MQKYAKCSARCLQRGMVYSTAVVDAGMEILQHAAWREQQASSTREPERCLSIGEGDSGT